jgi:N-acetylneuraminate synthase
MASLPEIADAVAAARDGGAKEIILLKCTSVYPAPPEEMNLRTIPHLGQAFRVPVGLSDHSMGIGAAVSAVALGAAMIEKHFTLARSDGGVDASFSLEPAELALLVRETRVARAALGTVAYAPEGPESSFRKYRRSLFFVRDVKAGGTVSAGDVRALRPGDGLPPKFLNAVIGRSLKTSVQRGTPVSWELLA